MTDPWPGVSYTPSSMHIGMRHQSINFTIHSITFLAKAQNLQSDLNVLSQIACWI